MLSAYCLFSDVLAETPAKPTIKFIRAALFLIAAGHLDCRPDEFFVSGENFQEQLVRDEMLLRCQSDDVAGFVTAADASRDNVVPLRIAGRFAA